MKVNLLLSALFVFAALFVSATSYTLAKISFIQWNIEPTDICTDSVVITNVVPLITLAVGVDTNIDCGNWTDFDLLVMNNVTNQYSDDFSPNYDPLKWNIIISGTANANCGYRMLV